MHSITTSKFKNTTMKTTTYKYLLLSVIFFIITHYTLKAQTITSMSPTTGSLAGGTVITLKGSGFDKGKRIGIFLKNATNPNGIGISSSSIIKFKSDSIVFKTPAYGSVSSFSVYLELVKNIKKKPQKEYAPGVFDYKLTEIKTIYPSSSSLEGGEMITIKGKYFTGATAVNFGKLGTTNIKVVSDSIMTVINPAAPKKGTVNVRVIIQGKKSNKNTGSEFTYIKENKAIPLVFLAKKPKETYIQFIGDKNLIGTYIDTKGKEKKLKANTSYNLKDLIPKKKETNIPKDMPVVFVKSFSGRVYVSLGAPIKGMSPNYTPNANGNPNLGLRYQYFEPTVKNSQMNVDLSYIDFTAISLSLEAVNATHGTNKKQMSVNSAILVKAAAKSALTKNGSVLPSSKEALPSSEFARVISPQLGNDGLYHDFTHYLKKSLQNTSTRIAGVYVGTGKQPSKKNPLQQAQSYDYMATFDSIGNVTLRPNAKSGNGKSLGVAKVNQGKGVGTKGGNIVISFDDLNAKTGIYGCNTPYKLGAKLKTVGITNDVYGRVVGDLLTGLNFGYLGSTKIFNGEEIGNLASTQWWGGTMPNGATVSLNETPGGQGMYFDKVQKNVNNYNTYAGSLSTLTTGYGFPFQDRLGGNLLTMNTASDPKGYLSVSIDIVPPVIFKKKTKKKK